MIFEAQMQFHHHATGLSSSGQSFAATWRALYTGSQWARMLWLNRSSMQPFACTQVSVRDLEPVYDTALDEREKREVSSTRQHGIYEAARIRAVFSQTWWWSTRRSWKSRLWRPYVETITEKGERRADHAQQQQSKHSAGDRAAATGDCHAADHSTFTFRRALFAASIPLRMADGTSLAGAGAQENTLPI